MDFKVQIHSGGRFVLPARLRKELKIKAGDEFVMRIVDGSIHLMPLHQAVKIAQSSVKKYVPKGQSLSEQLILARRDEAAHE